MSWNGFSMDGAVDEDGSSEKGESGLAVVALG